MSEQVTVIVHGKFHEKDSFCERRLVANKGENLLQLLKKYGYYARDCSGNGTCGKCLVRFVKDAPLPTVNERTLLSAEDLRRGCRMACRHTVMRETEIVLSAPPSILPDIVVAQESHRKKNELADVARDEASADEKVFLVADIGTTTIVMQAVRSGKIIGTYTALNPQRGFGADVAARISAAMQGHLQEMTDLMRNCLEEGIASLMQQSGAIPEFIVVAGNTTMNYLLRGLEPDVLGVYPFEPVDREPAEMVIGGIQSYILPGISAFVGGDIIAGMKAMAMTETEKYQMLVDLGTNGEIVLGKKGKLLCTATAAGPAFEGGVTSAIMGADLIRMTTQLLKEGVVDDTGLMQEPYFTQGIAVDNIILRQGDIRELQKAKAAIAAGVELLCKRYGIEPELIENVYLAGGFGYYLEPECAMIIGLFPENWRGRIRAVGNTALLGARQFGMQMLEQEKEHVLSFLQTECKKIQRVCQSINLAEDAGFSEKYVERLSFPIHA